MTCFITETSLAELVDPHQLVFIPGSAAAPLAFMDALSRQKESTRNLRILTSYVPSINHIDIDTLDPSVRVTGLFMHAGLRNAQRDGRYQVLPISYAAFVRYLLDKVDLDLTIAQVSPPDERGLCSLGPSVEFIPTALKKSRRVLGLINERTPYLPGSPTIPYRNFDYVCEVDTPLPEYKISVDEMNRTIARHVASLVSDGSVLQIGLGKVPAALSEQLHGHRHLRFHSGMLSDGLIGLAEAGAIDEGAMQTACTLVGSETLYRWAADFQSLRILGCEVTHDLCALINLEKFISINSALEVDLFGQCNLEHSGGRAISGPGGAPDFARAARLSPSGRSIIALQATHHHGEGSRIVPTLSPPSIASLSRVDIDYVVTEYGVAHLGGACIDKRAKALIAIAAPQFREGLAQAWHGIALQL
ncbi:acetyl-CoA hydrolase/transferase family protein [Ferribacterium limneticum]|uniref:acetyl-CoA hydrolase/transferase family protein n=1 Tax=Ferribacterium limneticum TaxID=76259 RepID=UPI001CF83E12|nr:acetyl-CoA hydrolase/transferase C-terminal domain-containing protein [Ferribacterium limneticum]UCV23655.1 hypothetical protein KI613_03705 [Ferribacterium limneticum]